MFLEHGTGAESDLVGVQDEIRIPLSIQKKALNMETLRASQAAGMAPWEMKSFWPKAVDQEEKGRKREGGSCVTRAEVNEGMFSPCSSCRSLLILRFYLESEPTDIQAVSIES